MGGVRVSLFCSGLKNTTHLVSHFGLHLAECVSPENNREPKQDDCDRHERRAGDVSEQDEQDGDDGEDCCDVVLHSFLITL